MKNSLLWVCKILTSLGFCLFKAFCVLYNIRLLWFANFNQPGALYRGFVFLAHLTKYIRLSMLVKTLSMYTVHINQSEPMSSYKKKLLTHIPTNWKTDLICQSEMTTYLTQTWNKSLFSRLFFNITLFNRMNFMCSGKNVHLSN
jgi:hypothetical protein